MDQQREQWTDARKREWQTPMVIVYGDAKELTRVAKLKMPGLDDDFQVPGVSDAQ
jgi:hypothetical protein